MKDYKILVTGGAGFIGSHLVDRLIDNNNKVIILDSLISSTKEHIQMHLDTEKCKFIKGDIRDESLLNTLDTDIDFVFHLAADPDVKMSVNRPVISFDHNVKGTLNILEFCRKNKVKGLVFASSGGTVYGDVNEFPISENSPLKPISPYGASKAAAEMYISAYADAYQIKASSGRFANIIGERSTHGVIYDFYFKLMSNPNELTILGDGMQKKSYLHVSDCVSGLIFIADNLESQNKLYEAYNIGSNEWITVTELAQIMENVLNLNDVKHVYTGGKKGWTGDVAKMLLEVKKLQKIGWKSKLNFKEAVSKYIDWLKKLDSKK